MKKVTDWEIKFNLFIDKKEISVSGIEGMSREKLEKRLEELETKINENKKIINVTPKEIN